MREKGGKPKGAFNALAIVMARDNHEILWDDLELELGSELGSTMLNLKNPNTKAIADLVARVGDGFYVLAWGDKKPHKKHGREHSYMPIKRSGDAWQMCSRRPPYHVLLEFKTIGELLQAIIRRVRAD